MTVQVPDEVFGVKEYECTVVSNKNVATFIKEFIVALPPGEHMDFIPGSYAQINIPKFSMDYTSTSTKTPSAPSTCPRGKSSASSPSNAATTRRRSAPIPWPTIRPRATASC